MPLPLLLPPPSPAMMMTVVSFMVISCIAADAWRRRGGCGDGRLFTMMISDGGCAGKLSVMWADTEKGKLQLPTVAVVRDGKLHSSMSRDQLFRDCRCSHSIIIFATCLTLTLPSEIDLPVLSSSLGWSALPPPPSLPRETVLTE